MPPFLISSGAQRSELLWLLYQLLHPDASDGETEAAGTEQLLMLSFLTFLPL